MTTSDDQARTDIQDTLASHLRDRLTSGADVTLEDFDKVAVGWSHETYLFDATWTDADGTSHRRPVCVRVDPGNALLRELSDLSEQYRVLECLARTDVPAPEAYWYEEDPELLGGPFVVMERVPGECPNPWGRAGRSFYSEAAERGVLPTSFVDALVAIHTADCVKRVSTSSAFPVAAPTSR